MSASVIGAPTTAAPVADCYVEARTRAGTLVRRHGPFVRDSADERMAYHAEECAALGWNRGRPHDDPRGLRVRCIFDAPAPVMVPQPAQQQQACAAANPVRSVSTETKDEFDAACTEACREHGGAIPCHDITDGVLTASWARVAVSWRFSVVAVPQPRPQQQAKARRQSQPARGERRYVTVRDTETGETHRVLTSVARVGVAVVIFVPSNRHRQGALNGMLITHDDIRKAWVFNDEAEARRMLSRNCAPGERVIRAELISDPLSA